RRTHNEISRPMKWLRKILGFLVEPAAVMVCVLSLYGSLLFAAVGQDLLIGGPGKDRKEWVLMLLLMVPLYVVFFLTYTKVSPVPARVYLAMLLLAMAWYATVTIICEVLLYVREIPAADDLPWKRNLARALMHLGWISLIPISFLYRSAFKYAVASRIA